MSFDLFGGKGLILWANSANPDDSAQIMSFSNFLAVSIIKFK